MQEPMPALISEGNNESTVYVHLYLSTRIILIPNKLPSCWCPLGSLEDKTLDQVLEVLRKQYFNIGMYVEFFKSWGNYMTLNSREKASGVSDPREAKKVVCIRKYLYLCTHWSLYLYGNFLSVACKNHLLPLSWVI